VKAVILAAGAGTRLGTLSLGLPKSLLPVGGRALLDHHLDALEGAGIREVCVVAGYASERIVAHVGGRARVVVNEDWETTNSIVSLYLASSFIAGDAFVFQNADVVYAPALVERFVRAGRPNACLVDPFRPYVDGEYHIETREGRVVRYSREVPASRSAGQSAQLVRVSANCSAPFLQRLGEIIAVGDDSARYCMPCSPAHSTNCRK